MTTVDILSPTGTAAGSIDLPAEVFDVQTNVPLIHQVVVAQLAAARQGTHSTKRRGEVRGGGRKPYKQKGTGRARQGSTRAPQFAGGGIVHGPKPRDYSQRTPKKMKAAALRGALSDRARHGRIHVLSALVEGAVPSAKSAAGVISSLSQRRTFLVVLDRSDQVGLKSVRNLQNVHVLAVDQLNTYDVLCAEEVVFTHAALQTFLGAAPVDTASSAVVVQNDSVQNDSVQNDSVQDASVQDAPVEETKQAKVDKPKADKGDTSKKADKKAKADKAEKKAKKDKEADK